MSELSIGSLSAVFPQNKSWAMMAALPDKTMNPRDTRILYIRNMVSHRCKMLVQARLNELNLFFFRVSLGQVEMFEPMTAKLKQEFEVSLRGSGLELINDRKLILIARIKQVLVEMIHSDEDLPKEKISVYLCGKLQHNYTYLANVFSETEGSTIENYLIRQRIERVKELISYNEMNLTEIAWHLHYSSVAHLSTQFKKVTGFTPSVFKSFKDPVRNRLEVI